MKHTVHLYYAVRIRMEDIEADSQEGAIAKADAECDVRESIVRGAAEWDESPHLGALVDEEGDEEYDNTRYHEGPGAKLYLAAEAAPSQAHVICCNDAVMAVVVGTDEQAEAAMETLIVEDYQSNKWMYADGAAYLYLLYWHIHTVRLIAQEAAQ